MVLWQFQSIHLAPKLEYITIGNEEVSMLVAMSKVTNQGQISIPVQIRRDLGIKPGSELIWDRNGNGEYMVRPKRLTLADLHQIVGTPSVHLSDLEIRQARQDFLASRTKRLASKKG